MSEVIYKKCPKCGATMERDDNKVYTSIPPQYDYICPNCGQIDYDTYPPRVSQVVNDLFDKNMRVPNEWELFRREVAKDTLCSMVSAYTVDNANVFPDPEEVCGMAVLYADELIKQLMEKK